MILFCTLSSKNAIFISVDEISFLGYKVGKLTGLCLNFILLYSVNSIHVLQQFVLFLWLLCFLKQNLMIKIFQILSFDSNIF